MYITGACQRHLPGWAKNVFIGIWVNDSAPYPDGNLRVELEQIYSDAYQQGLGDSELLGLSHTQCGMEIDESIGAVEAETARRGGEVSKRETPSG